MGSTASILAPQSKSGAGVSDWTLLLFAVTLLAVMQTELLFAKSINWDEFFHFSQIHAHLRGEPVQWLQTPHIRLFSWVPSLPGSPIDHIMLIRTMLLPLGFITTYLIYDIARRFSDRQSAAIASLAYLGGGYVFTQTFALRADMIAAALLTGAIWVLITRSRIWFWTAAAMLLCTLAFLATIKSVLFAPALIAAAVWRWHDRISGQVLIRIFGIGAVLAVLALAIIPDDISNAVYGLFKSSWNRMFSAGLFPQGRYFLVQLVTAPVLTCSIVAGLFAAKSAKSRMPFWMVIGLLLPLASVLIYRNAFPYFFAFILPPAAIAASLGVNALTRRYGIKLVLFTIVAAAAVQSFTEPRDLLERQRIVQTGISEIFPEPVRYIDDIAFRPDFPRALPKFASGWALEHYRSAGKPAYSNAAMSEPTPFLFRQGYALEVLTPQPDDEGALLPEDAAFLRDNYIEHWGRVYVAGKTITASDKPQPIEIAIPGSYTVEQGAIRIEGEEYLEGSVVNLDTGSHSIIATEEGGATLRWGNHLARPKAAFPYGPLFSNY